MGFYDSTGRFAALQTTTDLATGSQETLTVAWAPAETDRHDVTVVPGDPDAGPPLPVTFCTTPASELVTPSAGNVPRAYLPLVLKAALGGAAEPPAGDVEDR